MPEGAASSHVATCGALPNPPVEQSGKTLLRRRDRPVELRREVVDPSLLKPFAGIRVDARVRVETLHAGRVIGPPDPKWRDAHLDRRLDRVYLSVHSLDEPVDVGPSPVIASQTRAVFRERRIVMNNPVPIEWMMEKARIGPERFSATC